MKKITALTLLLCVGLAASAGADTETYFKFKIASVEETRRLTRIISIDRVQEGEVWAYANERQLAAFERLGYEYTVLPHPGTLIIPTMATTKSALADWNSYPSYDLYVSTMNQFATDYPDLCQIQSAGTSVQGRQILFAKISDSVSIQENEPEAMYSSSMHGDETTGYVLMLRLIDSLLTGYTAGDPFITRLVDSMEIWINPLANPDGTYIAGNSSVGDAQRYNANFVDLNRNFPDPEDGPHPDGNSWQPETEVMMDLAAAHHFTISANYHGGIEVVNYPWDTWGRAHVDDGWYQVICHQYADSAQFYSPYGYMDPDIPSADDGITNGFDWYEVNGGRQDYMNYWYGCREITLEISNTKLLQASLLPAYWTYNKTSFLQYLEHALYGIRGIVTDASTGFPIAATVRVLDHDQDNSEVFTDPDVGDYHRMIAAGVYDVEYSSLGYFADTVSGVVVLDGQATAVNAALTPMPIEPILTYAEHDAGPVFPGDAVSMSISLTNIGAGVANGVSTVLSTEDPYVSITQAGSLFPTIAVFGDTQPSYTDYEFDILPGCPLYHEVTFQIDVTADGGYAETLFFDIPVGQPVDGFESGDFSSLPWNHSGDADWQIVTNAKSEGSYAAQSGVISHDQFSQISVAAEVISPGRITFSCEVSSEFGWDFLEFYIDDVRMGAWSGEIPWTDVSYEVSTGSHTFSWKYIKDMAVSGGRDRARIDFIVFPLLTIDPVIITESVPDWTVGQPYSQLLSAQYGIGVLSWSDVEGDLDGTGLGLATNGILDGTPTATGPIQFTAGVDDQIGGSDERLLSFTINPPPSILTDQIPDGRKDEAYSFFLTSDGGTAPLVFDDRDNDLAPSGLVLTAAGELSGVPTTGGTFDFIARLQDAAGATVEKPLSIIIDAGCCTGTTMGNVDCEGLIDIADVTRLIQVLFITLDAPCCDEEADLDLSGVIDVGDLTALIASLFITMEPLPACP